MPRPTKHTPEVAAKLRDALAEGKARCRLHGGMSTGPRSEAGRAAIAESNKRRAGWGKGDS
jgi:hypothetical protein